MGLQKGCPCCKGQQNKEEFIKVLDFTEGLVVYLVKTPVTSEQQHEKNNNANDMFIIQNKTNRHVSTSKCKPELEDTVFCPRCRYIVKHAKDLLMDLPFIKKRDVIGVCDHCRMREQSNKPCNECQTVVTEFVKDKDEKIDTQQIDTKSKLKHVKELTSRMRNIYIDVEKNNQIEKLESTRRTHSETSLRKQDLPYKKKITNDYEILNADDIGRKVDEYLKRQSNRQIETCPLYTSKAESELSIIGAARRQKDIERQRNIHFKYSRDNVELISLKGSPDYISLKDKYYNQDKKYISRKTDLNVKRQLSSELNLFLDAPDREKTTGRKKQQLIHDESYIKYKKVHRHSYDDIRESRHEESDRLQKKYEYINEIRKRTLSDTNIRRYLSEESVKSISIATRDVPRKDFSYFFIKRSDATKRRHMISLSSSELVKDTQNMYKARAEEAKIKKELELKRKLEDDEKKLIAIEEKKKRQEEEETDKKLLKVKIEPDMHEKETKIKAEKEEQQNVPKEDKQRKKEDKEGKKAEKKEPTPKEINQKQNEERQKEKALKEEQIRLAKEEKQRLKEEKEKEKALKQDQMRLAKEEKQRLKEEKEREKALKQDQMRLAKEEKQRLKEEKEKEKAIKKEQMRFANEEKQRLKEEKEKAIKKDLTPLPNEEKQRLKDEKEKEKALKKDQMNSANVEKQRLQEEKEKEKALKKDQMHSANEEKQRLKEEKEKEKEKEKAILKDLMRSANEEKQRLKEGKEKEKALLKDLTRPATEEKQKNKEQIEKEKPNKEQTSLPKEEKQSSKNKPEREEEGSKIKHRDYEEKPSKKDQAITEVMLKKDKESKTKKTQEDEMKKKEAELKFKSLKESKEEEKSPKPETKKVIQEPQTKDLNIDQIKIRKPSTDDLILTLVKLKQSQGGLRERPTKMSQINVPEKIIVDHKGHKNVKNENCVICMDSDLDLDIENIMMTEGKSDKSNEIIIGPKIFRHKSSLVLKPEDLQICPLFFASKHIDDDAILKTVVIDNNIEEEKRRSVPPILGGKYVEQEVPKGITRYALSDRTFIEKGWTMLPTEKVVRKMNVYRMRPAHPEFDWFEHNKNKKLICYDTGEKLAEFDDHGKGRWFYRNGKVALDYYDAEELNAQQRIVIFSSGEPDEGGRPRPLTILATFDYLGNGIVFDHSGKIRLKYNQTEGVVLDRSIGPVSHWKWHTLNDPPVLQQVMIDTQMSHKDPQILKLGGPQENKQRPDNEEMLAIEFDNFIKEKSKKLSQKFKPFQIKMKALKINENFSLKVLDQATVYLIFRDGSTNLKLNIGMILDHQEIVDTDTAEVGEVSNSLERFPARTDSLAGLQRSVAHAQRVERSRVERERRLRPAQPTLSADQLTSGLSRPLRTQLHTVASTSDSRFCKCRRPSTTNVYYDNRLN